MLRIYSIVTPSHRRFFDDRFVPTLAEPCEVRVQLSSQLCATGEYLSDGWLAVMLEKVDLILRAIDETWGETFLYADADIQFFRPFGSIMAERLAGRDMVFQLDSPDGHVCAGFFAAASNDRTKAVWTDIRARVCAALDCPDRDPLFSDQTALNGILRPSLGSFTTGSQLDLKWDYLPSTVAYSVGAHTGDEWEPGDPVDPPAGLVVHHANWTKGLGNKTALLRAVRTRVAGSESLSASQRGEIKVVLSTAAGADATWRNDLDMSETVPPDDVPDRVAELEDRISELESKIGSLERAYSLSRHQARRTWLRPPMWTFEQYSPRPVKLKSSYARARVADNTPTIAVVTPSYNHQQFLGQTVDSVLAQDYPRLSYHVQDAGSSDGSAELLAGYGPRISWRSEKDAGQAQGINRGFACVDGEIMAYLNSDDMLLPGTLAYVANVFAKRPDVDVIYGHRIFVDRDGLEIGRAVLPQHDKKALCWADYVPQETLFWRRRVWEAVGPFDETFDYALDWDFILRAQEQGFNFRRVPRFLGSFRVHQDQKTAALYETGRREMQILRKRYIGHEPAQGEIVYALSRYLARQLMMHLLYKAGLLRA